MNNYTVVFEKEAEDLKSRALLLRHDKTGARIFVLSNDDDNKVFYVGFRTPPADDTGVAHIMEHSVLCGSEKYPLKDPFVELAKGSLNTFLNAMTFPDKTVYPVASRNEKDIKNLMDVYLDAVFHPNIYSRPEIMKQEGWNYKLENPEDEIEYNGVVYNEMKGAFSSPEGVLEREILHSLYPDTTYGVESGGDPKSIPELTYENFLDFHRKYYHPSNSFIYLYGDYDIEERLEYLDREYLGKYDRMEVNSEIRLQKPFARMADYSIPYPISEDEEEKDNTYLTYNMVCGTNLDPKQYYSMQMILYALVDTQGAPIRERLLKEGICKDVLSTYENGIIQPYFGIIAKNANLKNKDRFIGIIDEELLKAATKGLEKKSLIACLNSLEFRYKEADFGGYPKGLVYGLNCLDSWLYDENNPLLHIECTETFEFLRSNIDTGYFESLIKQYLIKNPHSSILSLVPQKGLTAKNDEETAKKLKDYKKSLSKKEIKELVNNTRALAAYQEEEDDRKTLECIPLLERSDIQRTMDSFKNEEKTVADIPVVFHEYNTNGISYASCYFDANSVKPEDLPYLSILKSIFSFVDTKQHSYYELNNEINTYTGSMGFDFGVYNDRIDPDKQSVLADVSFRMLTPNTEKTFDLVEETMFESIYEDTSRLYDIVAELKSKLQMSLNSSGHVAATMRALSYFSRTSYLKEITNGIEFYKFVENLEKHFDDNKELLIQKIKSVTGQIFDMNGILVSFTGNKEDYDVFARRLVVFANRLKEHSQGKNNSAEPVRFRRYLKTLPKLPDKKNEGFKTSAGVQYVARAGRYIENGTFYTGALRVFKTIMSYDYLWFNIRVQGGAYGCMCNTFIFGDCTFVTYRDPHLSRSNSVFEGIPDFLESFDADEREMTKYVIGTMSSVDFPLTSQGKGSRDMNAYLLNINEEEYQKQRNETIDCTAEDIRKLAPLMKKALSDGYICVVGNEQKIEAEKEMFLNTRNLFE